MKIKKIIARQGLIFLAILIVSVIMGYRGYEFFWTEIVPQIEEIAYAVYPTSTLTGVILHNILTLYIVYFSFLFFIFVIRFIFWALRTIRKK